MRILSQRTSVYIPAYELVFTYGDTGGCFGFPSNKDGDVDVSKLAPKALENYQACMSGKVVTSPRRQMRTYVHDGETHYENAPGCDQQVTYTVSADVRDYGKWDRTPAVGECDHCGLHVHLHGFTNTCECGADYNMSGQLLASRSQWGEETGESVADILSVDMAPTEADGWDAFEPNTYNGS